MTRATPDELRAINARIGSWLRHPSAHPRGELVCPNCDGEMHQDAGADWIWHCEDCGLVEQRD